MYNNILKKINIKDTIETAKDELYFLKTYIGNVTLMNYISSPASFISIHSNQSTYMNHDQKLIHAIEEHDYQQKLINDRLQAIISLDYPLNELLYKKFVEKKNDDDICQEMGFSDSTRKRRLKEAYLQFAFRLGIVIYNDNTKFNEYVKENDFHYKYHSIHDSVHDEPYTLHQEKLLKFCTTPKTRDEMQKFCGIESRPYFSQFVIKPLVKKGKLKMTCPDKPKSKNQRYYTS